MLDKSSEYVKTYLKKIQDLHNDIVKQDCSSLKEHVMPWGTTDGEEWTCKAIKTTSAEVCLNEFYSEKLKDLIFDENILSISIHKLPPKSSLTPHIDPPTHKKNVWRLLLPIQSKDYWIKRSGQITKMEVGYTYEIDHTYEVHSSWNSSNIEDFIVWIFDIFYEDRSDYNFSSQHRKKLPKSSPMKHIDHYMNMTDLGSLTPNAK